MKKLFIIITILFASYVYATDDILFENKNILEKLEK